MFSMMPVQKVEQVLAVAGGELSQCNALGLSASSRDDSSRPGQVAGRRREEFWPSKDGAGTLV